MKLIHGNSGKVISATVKIMRKDGKIEDVVLTDNRRFMTDATFQAMKDATFAAGRGHLLSYKLNIEPTTAPKVQKTDWNDVINEGGEGFATNNW